MQIYRNLKSFIHIETNHMATMNAGGNTGKNYNHEHACSSSYLAWSSSSFSYVRNITSRECIHSIKINKRSPFLYIGENPVLITATNVNLDVRLLQLMGRMKHY